MAIFNQLTDILGGTWYPTGSIVMFPSDDIPKGWLKCDGTAYSYTAQGGKYKSLYDVIGTTFGTGEEGSTFKVPDLSNRFVEGASTDTGHTLGSYVDAGLPDNTHTFSGSSVKSTEAGGHAHWGGTKRIWDSATGSEGSKYKNSGTTPEFSSKIQYMVSRYGGTAKYDQDYTSTTGSHTHTFTAKGSIGKASANNAIYGASTTVQPKALCLNYIIKY